MSRSVPDPRFSTAELERFLAAVDQALERPAAIIVIGGSAVGLAHGVELRTRDIDTFESDVAVLERALEMARERTALPVPVAQARVADAPWNYEDRLRLLFPEFARLRVLVPEKHDLVLCKLVRAYPNDMVHIQELHDRDPLDLDTLLARTLDEMTHVIGGVEKFHANLADCVERLWGEVAAVRVRARLG
jgi:hypothetical protein